MKQDILEKRTNIGVKMVIWILFIYLFLRSCWVGFTHDESLSYSILKGNTLQLYTANNHWLNTIFMKFCSICFGFSEWSLRLPNVLSFLIYGFSIFKILRLFHVHFLMIWFSIFVFLLNPFLLDFFSLARGYGLGMGFLALALFQGLSYFYSGLRMIHLIGFVLSSVACIYANYSFFTTILALHLVFFVQFSKSHLTQIKRFTVVYLIECCLLIPAILNIQYLSKMKELYAGGENSVFQDTLKSIFHFSYHTEWFDFTFWGIWIFSIVFVLSLLFWKSKTIQITIAWILFLIVIPTLLHGLMNLGFAKDRAAIYWILMGGMMVVFTFNELIQSKVNQYFKITFYIVGIMIVSINLLVFMRQSNFTHSIIWKNESDVLEALKIIETRNQNKENISIGISWTLEPSINYYRETKSLNWLKPVNRDGIQGEFDYYLCFEDDFKQLENRNTILIKRFDSNELNLSFKKK